MLAFLVQVRSVVDSVALVAVEACVVVSAAASAVVVVVAAAASEVDMHRKDPAATSRAKISMRTTQDLINLVATVVFVWIVMVEATVEATVTSNLSRANKSWFAM